VLVVDSYESWNSNPLVQPARAAGFPALRSTTRRKSTLPEWRFRGRDIAAAASTSDRIAREVHDRFRDRGIEIVRSFGTGDEDESPTLPAEFQAIDHAGAIRVQMPHPAPSGSSRSDDVGRARRIA
jgi:hypothetical protein